MLAIHFCYLGLHPTYNFFLLIWIASTSPSNLLLNQRKRIKFHFWKCWNIINIRNIIDSWKKISGGNCQEENCPWGELPVGGNNRGEIIREGIVRGGNCPWEEVIGGGNVREGIVRDGKCPGWKAPRGTAWGWSVLEPKKLGGYTGVKSSGGKRPQNPL